MLYELEHWIKEKYLFQKWNIYLQQIQHSLNYRHKMRSAIVTFITTTLVLVTKSYIFPMLFIPGFFGSVAQLCPTLCDPMNGSTPGLPVHHQLLEFTQTPVHWVGDAVQNLILCRPFLLLPSIFPSIRVFSNESALHIRWPKCWSFSFKFSPSNEHPGLIFRMDWVDLLAVQGTLKKSSPTPQFKSINSSALSFLYSPTLTSIHDHWKNHSLD